MDRPYEKYLYELWSSKFENTLPDWNSLNQLWQLLNIQQELNEKEKAVLWQSGTSFKCGCAMIEDKKLNEQKLPPHAIVMAGFHLILYGTFLQLKVWSDSLLKSVVKKLENNDNKRLIGSLRNYLLKDEFRHLRDALAHSGDDENETYYRISLDDQTVKIKTKNTGNELSINIFEVLIASLLCWLIYSEWTKNRIN